jgi:site-specific DNA-methyltransferase (adenine-specific)
MTSVLYQDDCFNVFPTLEDNSIDLVLCDMPYGTTACKWDTCLDLESMWKHLKRICKPKAAVVLTASQPFTTTLICSNRDWFKYCLVWSKLTSGSFVQAKRMPLKTHEDIVVFNFDSTLPHYNPQMRSADKIKKEINRVSSKTLAIPTTINTEWIKKTTVYKERYPLSVLEFTTRAQNGKTQLDRGLHPTQKPVALMEYLIKTYSNEGDVVLDFCMGSGTTGVACKRLNRQFIGIEKDEAYYKIAEERINSD